MAKLTDKPAARTFRVADGAPKVPARTVVRAAAPAMAGVRHDVSPFAKGMGMDARAQETLRKALRPIGIGELLAGGAAPEGLDGYTAEFPGCAVQVPGAAYSCSQQVFDFLASNVLRNSDIIPVIRSGWVQFDRRIGVHDIPLALASSDDSLPGDINVPDNQALIVTSFTPFAALNMPGLAGSFISVDPQSLVGQVAFFLRADNGVRPLSEQSLTAGTMAGGTEIVNDDVGNVTPPFTDVAKQSVGAGYEVIFQPTPGFPSIVGCRVRGYMVNQQLLAEALDNKSYRAGG